MYSWGYYEGEFVNGKRQGSGKMVCSDGTVYKGNFENDQMIYSNE